MKEKSGFGAQLIGIRSAVKFIESPIHLVAYYASYSYDHIFCCSEYRALINHLSASSANQSELVNTSAEVHVAPHTTPVENVSQELSPSVSPVRQR